MRKLLLVASLAVAMFFGSHCVFAQKGKNIKAIKGAFNKGESVEKSGVVEVQKAEKGQKFDNVTLKIGSDVFRLIPTGPGKKGMMDEISKLAGKEITVKGILLPVNPPKFPLAAIKVESFGEKKADSAAAATPSSSGPTKEPASVASTPAPAPAPAKSEHPDHPDHPEHPHEGK